MTRLYILFPLLCSTLCWAQTASLSGTVTDPSRAPAANVMVKAAQPATSLERSTRTNAGGAYTFAALPPGEYEITVGASGFRSIRREHVRLEVSQSMRLDFALELGTVDQSVIVSADPPPVTAETGTLGTTVGREFVEAAPLNGRTFQSLIALTPGTVMTKANGTDAGQFSVNGQRANANYFMIDGASANIGVSANAFAGQPATGSTPGMGATGGTNNLVSMDALQEFRIVTSAYAPEFGRTPGGQVAILTRSGTNEFHGTLFEYFRNDVLDANDWFANRNGQNKPALRQNDFGGVLGGPIRKNRLFFFGSYEALRLRLPLTATTDVPSLAARAAAPAAIQPYLATFPVPTGPAQASGFAPFTASYSDPSTLNAGSMRVDYIHSERLRAFARFNEAPSDTVQRGVFTTTLNTLVATNVDVRTFTAGADWSISPRVTNEARVNWSRSAGGSNYSNDGLGGAAIADDAALFPASAPKGDSLFFFNLNGGRNSRVTRGKLTNNEQRQWNFADSFSWVNGAHHVKAGFDYRRLSPLYGIRKYLLNAIFNGVTGAVAGTASSVTVGAQTGDLTPVFTNFSSWIQDSWQLRRLTLTYGIRWELNPAPTEANGRQAAVMTTLDDTSRMSLAPAGTSIYETSCRNFAPRIGLAYRLSDRTGRETLLRAGAGVFYDLGSGIAAQVFSGGYPFFTSKVLRNVAFPLTAEQSAAPEQKLAPPYGTIYAFDAKLKLPRSYQWNVTLDQALGTRQAVSAAYVGAIGRNLLRTEVLQPVSADFGTVYATRNLATSDYHAMQLQFRRSVSNGLQALASYTWSHSIDINSSDAFYGSPSGKTDPRADRGSSDFDVRHSFSSMLSYELPRMERAGARRIVTGWSFDLIAMARSATPVNIVTGADGLLIGRTDVARPDVVAGVPLEISDANAPGGRRFNRAAFATPSNRQGTLGRNVLRAFPMSQFNLAVRRRIPLSERCALQVRAEAFNVLNHANFGDPTASLLSSTFGESAQSLGRDLGGGGNAGGLNPLYQSGGARSMQLALRLTF